MRKLQCNIIEHDHRTSTKFPWNAIQSVDPGCGGLDVEKLSTEFSATEEALPCVSS